MKSNLILRIAVAIVCLLLTNFAQTQPLSLESKSDYQQMLIKKSEDVQLHLRSLKEIPESYESDVKLTSNLKSRQFESESVETPGIVMDSLALVALYNSTNGPGWSVSANWLTGPLDTWVGITVSGGSERRVISVDLYNNNLVGSIPAEIGNLTKLAILYLFNNQLTGSIPNTIGNLTGLYDLYLSGNQLNGNIPAEIGNMISLENLNLTSNELTGSIPAEIGNLSNLKNLMVSSNQLTGNIPHEIGNLTQLQLLFMFSNHLTGSIPVEIGNLSLLNKIQLGGNNLTGNLPSEIGNLSKLEELFLYDNQLSGVIPITLGNLINLKVLFLSYNNFSGLIPAEIGSLYNLNSLNLDGNQLTGSLPHEIYNLFNLVGLNLFGNLLTGTIHNDIGNLSKLQVLALASNLFEGHIPQEICNLNKLVVLNIYNCKFENLPDLHALTALTTLIISHNKFTFDDIEPNIGVAGSFDYSPQDSVGVKQNIVLNEGESSVLSVAVGGSHNTYQWYKDGNIISGALSTLFAITSASQENEGIYTCQISNTIAPALVLYSRPVTIHVNGATVADSLALVAFYNSTNGPGWTDKTNWLTGPVNTWNGITLENGKVVGIYLENNNLSGTIPNEIGDLTNLKNLGLTNNHLTGSIPTSIGKLTLLETWMTSGNHLTGSIPKEIGNMTSLHIFYCGTNQLTGNIHNEIGNLVNLEFFGINNNQITGTIPAEIGNLSNLKQLGLWDNQLSGSIPAALGNLTNLNILYLTNNQLSGSIPRELGNMSKLTGLELGINKLSGEIPEELGNLTKLQSIDFSYNQLTGSVPSSITNLTALMHLFLQSNYLENLPDLQALSHLDYLSIQLNKFTFKDIEPNMGLPNFDFYYAPQDSLGIRQLVKVSAGENISLSVAVGGSHDTYHWFKNGQIIPGAQSRSLTIANANTINEGVYTCWIDNTVVPNLTLVSRPMTVKILPPQPGPISGDPKVCLGTSQAYSIDAIVGATSYTWTLPSGWTGNSTSNSITVNPSATSGNVTVAANNSNGTGPSVAFSVTVNSVPAKPASITGNESVCKGSSQTYSIAAVSEATAYLWSLPPYWTGSSFTNSITGVAGMIGAVTVMASNNCGISPPTTLMISVAAIPTAPVVETINQTACGVEQGSISLGGLPATGTWTLTRSPGSVTFSGTGNSTQVNNLNPGTYTFVISNEYGCTSPVTENITINDIPETPSAPSVGNITQPSCFEPDGSVILNGLPASGTWELTSLPESILLAGTGTEMTITGLAPGTYVFEVTNDSECSSVASAEVVINEIPIVPEIPMIDSIVHPACDVSTGSIHLINLPSAGNWTLTMNPGSADYNGTGTGIVISDLASGTYTFTVTNESGCTSVVSEEALINIQPETPEVPVITLDNKILCSDAAEGNQWYNHNGIIQDACSQNFEPAATGNYYVVVSNGMCSSGASNIINFVLTASEQSELEQSLVLYPNPVSDELVIEIKNRKDKINYEIINAAGGVVINGTIVGRTMVKTADFTPGIYMIKIETEHSYIIKKIVKE